MNDPAPDQLPHREADGVHEKEARRAVGLSLKMFFPVIILVVVVVILIIVYTT